VPIEVLDPALTRPGRMGRHIWFRTPTKDDRLDIFELYLQKVDHEPDLDTPRRREELARITSGYSPAMIEQCSSMALTIAHAEGRRLFGWSDLVEAMTTVETGTAQNIEYIAEETRAVAIHEAGHALNYAFRLHERPDFRSVFGDYGRPYAEHYPADPMSRDHVRHILGWYAQKHPDEDFAETFAVWLTPGLDWRGEYAGWGALRKLEWLDGVTVVGRATGQSSPMGDLRVAAEAALHALESFAGGALAFELAGIKALRAFDANIVIVAVGLRKGEGPTRLLGSYLAEQDPVRAADELRYAVDVQLADLEATMP